MKKRNLGILVGALLGFWGFLFMLTTDKPSERKEVAIGVLIGLAIQFVVGMILGVIIVSVFGFEIFAAFLPGV